MRTGTIRKEARQRLSGIEEGRLSRLVFSMTMVTKKSASGPMMIFLLYRKRVFFEKKTKKKERGGEIPDTRG